MPSSTMSQGKTAGTVLALVCLAHFLNDLIQSVIPSAMPLIKENLGLTFAEVGLLTLVIQLTSSILQPLVGLAVDKKRHPAALSVGMLFTLVGVWLLSRSAGFYAALAAVALTGCGSAIFHPECVRIAQSASGGKKGLAQSVFQVGGNLGFAVGPLATAVIILPYGQGNIAWFSAAAACAAVVLFFIGRAGEKLAAAAKKAKAAVTRTEADRRHLVFVVVLLLVLMFSKQIYHASLGNFLTFYVMEKFGVTMAGAQYVLFAFLAAGAVGTLLGGPMTDRFGRRAVIFGSIFGAAPFALLLPWTGLAATVALAVIVSFIISSAFSAIVVCALDAMPEHTGLISGLFFGLSFGIGGAATAVFGWAADVTSLDFVFTATSFLPLIGLAALWLPKETGR